MVEIDRDKYTLNKGYQDRWKVEVNEHESELNAKRVSIVNSNLLKNFYTNNIYDGRNYMYIGKENSENFWVILYITFSTTETKILGASNKNNNQYTTYIDAWNNRTSLEYDYLKIIL